MVVKIIPSCIILDICKFLFTDYLFDFWIFFGIDIDYFVNIITFILKALKFLPCMTERKILHIYART
jgi:hypothetical protein